MGDDFLRQSLWSALLLHLATISLFGQHYNEYWCASAILRFDTKAATVGGVELQY